MLPRRSDSDRCDFFRSGLRWRDLGGTLRTRPGLPSFFALPYEQGVNSNVKLIVEEDLYGAR